MGKKQFETAQEFIERAEKLNNQVIRSSQKNATAYSYKGAFMGFRIGLNRMKSVYLWPESRGYIDRALKLEPTNVQAIIDKGNMLYYSPGMLGGDKEDAVVLFLKAEKLMEKNKETDHNWVYLNLLVTLAKASEKLDKPQEAKLFYEKALQKEPNFRWVKDDLYPKLLLKLKQ
jgi:tetratricopeptide (TPR) repeat protein